jgi:hypothetical protein
MGNNFDYDFTTNSAANLTSDQAAALGMGAFLGAYTVFMVICVLAIYAVMAISLMKIAQKTGFGDKAWWAWVPILNIVLNYNMGGYSGWWMILPFANIVVIILAWMKISVKCGKPDWLGLLMIISPLNLIIPLYLAYSNGDKK